MDAVHSTLSHLVCCDECCVSVNHHSKFLEIRANTEQECNQSQCNKLTIIGGASCRARQLSCSCSKYCVAYCLHLSTVTKCSCSTQRRRLAQPRSNVLCQGVLDIECADMKLQCILAKIHRVSFWKSSQSHRASSLACLSCAE